jgi:hypothetical protein
MKLQGAARNAAASVSEHPQQSPCSDVRDGLVVEDNEFFETADVV